MIDIYADGDYNQQWLKELEQLPTKRQLKRNLIDLMTIDKRNMSVEDIKQLFFKKAFLFPRGVDSVEQIILNTLVLWRTRKISENEDINIQRTFSYPLSCSENGRAHLKEQPVFYCANSKATALFESRPIQGEILFLSKWKVTSDRNTSIQYLFPETLPEKNPFHSFSLKRSKEIEIMSANYGRDKEQQLEMITRFMGNAFVKEEKPYCLTSWIGNEILFGNNKADILAYPSISRQLSDINFAIPPSFVNDYLQIDKVYKIIVVGRTHENIKCNIIALADNSNGNLFWRDFEDGDMKLFNE